MYAFYGERALSIKLNETSIKSSVKICITYSFLYYIYLSLAAGFVIGIVVTNQYVLFFDHDFILV